jgi:hypothetical protein
MIDDAVPSLHAVLDGAKSFGLTDAEAWRVMDQCLNEAGEYATVAEYLDELTDALAREILAKQGGEPRSRPAGTAVPPRSRQRRDDRSA